MRVTDLPTEVILEIFYYLEKRHISKCIRVCKKCQISATQVFYEGALTLKAYNIAYVKHILQKPSEQQLTLKAYNIAYVEHILQKPSEQQRTYFQSLYYTKSWLSSVIRNPILNQHCKTWLGKRNYTN
jgi:hypothetical protein